MGVALPQDQVAQGKEDKVSGNNRKYHFDTEGRGHLQIRCIFFLIKLGSLALCAFPPGILRLLFLFPLCSYFPSPLRQDPTQLYVLRRQSPGVAGPAFPYL